MNWITVVLILCGIVGIGLFIGTSCSKKKAAEAEAKAEMDFTVSDTTKKQIIIDEKGVMVMGFCWQDRPFLIATQKGFGGGDGLQLLRIDGWCNR